MTIPVPTKIPATAGNRQDISELRIDLAAAFRLAARFGMHEGTCNHMSAMVPGTDGQYLINARGAHWSLIRASDIIVIDADGDTVEGAGAPIRSGACIHTRIHLHHPDAAVVLHTHMPWATTLACMEGARLEPVHQNAIRFHGRCAYDEDFNGFAVEPAEGERMARAMAGKPVIFLGNHGVIVVGASVAEAFDDLYYLERACQIQVMVMQAGGKALLIPEAMAAKAAAQLSPHAESAALHFTALKRILDREEPDYAS